MPPRIFISYRRDDAAGDAGRLADHLHRRFGATHVFLDIDTIDPGTDFVQVLRVSLEQTAAMLVVIGPRWTSLRGADGTRRLDDENDFVRLEVETALGRSLPVVPVLVQGATLPRKEDLPASLAPLATRQVAVLDHAEFHVDVERLCDRLAPLIEVDETTRWSQFQRWWPAAAVVAVLALGLIGYRALYPSGDTPAPASTAEDVPASVTLADRPATTAPLPEAERRVEALLSEASAQQRRDQFVEALSTLARAREAAPASETVRRMQEDVAMDWIRSARVESGKSSFGEAIKPALAVVDASLPAATGQRRADLLAHSGWATFLMWRDGNRRLNPAEWYRDALSLDPGNPYANAMLAHWLLVREDDVPRAVKLFDAALQSGRASGAVRVLQWAGYNNARTPESAAERVRLADAMRRGGERLDMGQAQALWGPYYSAMPTSREKERQVLLEALAPDDHISTLGWAFEEYAAKDESRRHTIRYYVALLHARAGREDRAAADLRTLGRELNQTPGSLSDAVRAALRELSKK
jgi:tetratricopeptide (TPR) repeat protein